MRRKKGRKKRQVSGNHRWVLEAPSLSQSALFRVVSADVVLKEEAVRSRRQG